MTNSEMRTYVHERCKVAQSGCWEWKLALDKDGYGRAYTGGKTNTQKAHRFSYVAFRGEIPAGKVIMHSCDNPRCVNPAHLTPGTQMENIADSRAKMRGGAYFYSGEENPKSILKDDDVRKVRSLKLEGLAHSAIAAMIGCSKTLVTLIVTGRRWSHVV